MKDFKIQTHIIEQKLFETKADMIVDKYFTVKKSEEYFDEKMNNSLYENIDKTLENIRNAFHSAFVRKIVVL